MAVVRSELRKDSLSFIEALGQSVANVSPTLTPALVVTVVAGMAGTASWLVYVFATFALLIVGINIGKLARRLTDEGKSVMLAAGDTFRSAAVEQLEVWAKASGAAFASQQTGADPGAVVFDALQAALNQLPLDPIQT